MTAIVRFSTLARSQVESVDTWWRKEREAAPDLFSEELAEALDCSRDIREPASATSRGGSPAYGASPFARRATTSTSRPMAMISSCLRYGLPSEDVDRT
jgi:hypothetical protein